jgi:aspartate/methionine/tyrosine aminotransferase
MRKLPERQGNLAVEYLRWAKLHNRLRYEMTVSGMPAPAADEFSFSNSPAPLVASGGYGHPDLIDAVARRYAVAQTGVVPVPGTSSGIFMALAACANHSDRVALERPIYDPIRRAARFLGLQVIELDRSPQREFAIDPAAIEAALQAGARVVFLTNLHNPSGQYIPPAAMKRAADLCAKYRATLLVDEVYLDSTHIARDEPLWTAAAFGSHVATINSLTKVYGLPGLRVGWILAGDDVAERARKIMDLLSVDNASPSAAMGIEALRRIHELEARFREFHRRGQSVFRAWLEANPAFGGYDNHGAIFECLRLPDGVTSERLCAHLQEHHAVQVTPGRFFNLEDHIRISLTLPEGELEEALTRIGQGLRELRQKRE